MIKEPSKFYLDHSNMPELTNQKAKNVYVDNGHTYFLEVAMFSKFYLIASARKV